MVDNQPALLVIDVQRGFDDTNYWGPRNNPACEANIRALVEHWRKEGRPLVLVRHDSTEARSPLRPGAPGNDLAAFLPDDPTLIVTKSVNSAFYGTPDLHSWLQERGIGQLVICGLTTNHCCETTARMAGNLGDQVRFVLDATATFDRPGPDGVVIPAADIARVSAASLHGEFADVCATADVLDASAGTIEQA